MAIMRPGCTDAMRADGGEKAKSVTQHYIDRKNGVETVKYVDPVLSEVLGPTYGELIYQEQAMQIAQLVAGFTLQQADILRKAIGKKKPEVMAEVKKDFMEGVKQKGIISLDTAQIIWDGIESSQRYSFNKSHSVSYAINAYLSAYAKAHFPRAFFTSYLYHAQGKAKPHEEIKELVNNARLMHIDVNPPDFRHLNPHFKLIDKDIYFGFVDIKGIGSSMVEQIVRKTKMVEEELKAPCKEWKWIDFLINVAPVLRSTDVKAIISTGGLGYMGMERLQMLFEYEAYAVLSGKESNWVSNYYKENRPDNLITIFEAMVAAGSGKEGSCANKKRLEIVKGILKSLHNPPHCMTDSPVWVAEVEQNLLGIPLTCTIVDSCDKTAANCNCREFANGSNGKQKVVIIAAKVEEFKEIKTKRGKSPGQRMGFLTISDETGVLDSVVIFPEQWAMFKGVLFEDNTIMVVGERSKDKNSLIVKKIWQI
jgi:DNA polymerase-3 subunit alpha